MKKCFFLLSLWGVLLPVLAQDTTRSLPVQADFLFHYYEQDGTHSAVTGGRGTEELQDISNQITAYIPLDTAQSIHITTGLSHYTSASTDNIDFHTSSASAHDNRAYFRAGYTRRIGQQQWGAGGGTSIESDYISTQLQGHWSWQDKTENQTFQIHAQAFWDKWIMIFPEELRQNAIRFFDTDRRRSYHVQGSFAQVFHPRLQGIFSAAVQYQEGTLSTPFHRTYLEDATVALELLPARRWRVPLSARLHYFAWDRWVFRNFYRFYMDDWGLRAHTWELDIAWKLHVAWQITPFYRYYTQVGSRYFAPYAQHQIAARFRTSDYDLSSFYSHSYGLDIRYAPLWGIGRKATSSGRWMWKALSVRGNLYTRSDGLQAWMWSLASQFTW